MIVSFQARTHKHAHTQTHSHTHSLSSFDLIQRWSDYFFVGMARAAVWLFVVGCLMVLNVGTLFHCYVGRGEERVVRVGLCVCVFVCACLK